MNNALLIQIIESLGIVLAALGPSLVGVLWVRKNKAVAELKVACNDILFLLEVEKRHGLISELHEGKTNKHNIRAQVRSETNLDWSGKFTPSRIKQKSNALTESTDASESAT